MVFILEIYTILSSLVYDERKRRDKNSMDKIRETILDQFQVRKNRKQKKAFREYIMLEIEKMGYSAKEEKGGIFGSVNLVVGNVDEAEVLFTAHYDTCARMIFPNFITPMNMPVYLIYQFALVLGIFFASFVSGFVVMVLTQSSFMAKTAFSLSCYLFCFLLIFGPANPVSVNDNTSGVLTVLEVMKRLAGKQEKVAFVLFDNEELGMLGAGQFVKKHKSLRKHALVLNFDCVSDGDTFLLALSKPVADEAETLSCLKQCFDASDNKDMLIERNAFYPSDQKMFRRGIGIAALKKNKWIGYYMDRIHTSKDTVLMEENLDILAEKSAYFIKVFLNQ